MNSFEVLQAMTEIPNEHILSARDRLGYGQEKMIQRKTGQKRIWLIAAIIALVALLVGCTVVYFLSLQDMKVGEYSFYVPPAYDDDGNLIPVETDGPIAQISLQGANMEALGEWLEFTNNYDRDLSVAIEVDRTGSAWKEIPENYHLTYGCYSQEMVDKLNEIVKKYDLKLLSTYFTCEYYESNVILGALGLESLTLSDKSANVEYGSGYFFPEGTFDIAMTVSMDTADWDWGDINVYYRYSLKEYFDNAHGAISEIDNCTQWNYTRKNGQTVLLVLTEESAKIYADLPDAFISIGLSTNIWEDGKIRPLSASALEQMAELFDFSINPKAADMALAEKLKVEAQAEYEASKVAAKEKHDTMLTKGYDDYVKYVLEKNAHRAEYMSYALYDVNGDGIKELIVPNLNILSIKNGESYSYFNIAAVNIAGAAFHPCEGNVFELCHDYFAMHQYYFYRAEAEGATFITGVIHDTNEDIWYRSLSGGSYNEDREQITAEEAQRIRDSYTRIEIDMLPLQKYGQEVTSVNYTDPYSKYITGKLDRYENAVNYQYCLLDVNGDGIEELITRDVESYFRGETYYLLSIHSIKDGKLWDMGIDMFSYVCEGGVLEDSEDYLNYGDGSAYHYFYRCTENGVEPIEKIVRDPISLYWGHALAGQDGKTVTEEKAKSILNSYRRLDLDWKPFTEYPLS